MGALEEEKWVSVCARNVELECVCVCRDWGMGVRERQGYRRRDVHMCVSEEGETWLYGCREHTVYEERGGVSEWKERLSVCVYERWVGVWTEDQGYVLVWSDRV